MDQVQTPGPGLPVLRQQLSCTPTSGTGARQSSIIAMEKNR